MQNELAVAPASDLAPPPSTWSYLAVRVTTALVGTTLVLGGVAVNASRYVRTGHHYTSPLQFFAQQVDIFGLEAAVLAVVTLSMGLFYGRGLARAFDVHPGRARAVHMTLAMSTLTVIGLHLAALAASSGFGATAARLLVPFAWNDRFPDPVAAGALGMWLIALFGLSYFVRGRLGGHRRWRVMHRVVLVGFALTVLHSVLLIGWIPGWAM